VPTENHELRTSASGYLWADVFLAHMLVNGLALNPSELDEAA
jgi:hypothetical protein